MTAPQRDTATQTQVEAADPTASTWVAANAGSGKTRVLTDRVARLLLAGTPPENVLCLTYTKAAASEMQNRLFTRLGGWSMMPDAALAALLRDLGVEDTPEETLARARRLFARAIETPGGLKIQTIHSFCAAILRRFPLEAGVPPGFVEMDETAAALLQAEVVSRIAGDAPETFAEIAALVSDEDFAPLCTTIQRYRRDFPESPSWEETCARFDLDPQTDIGALKAAVLDGPTPDSLRAIADVLAGQSKTMQVIAPLFADLADHGPSETRFEDLASALLVSDRSRANSKKPTASARTALGPLADSVDDLVAGLLHACEAERALNAATRTHALHRFAALFLPAYSEAKLARGLLDFDDLIERAEALLRTPGVADWVLYRLDGGIDHVLVDEAQDTSPLQWRVIEHLTREFTAGTGAQDPGERTIFVVGDLKQSIYSFQGADPDGFGRMRAGFAGRLAQVGQRLLEIELEHSFRAAPEILRVVDNTFPPENRVGLGDEVSHIAFHQDRPGRVELWPLIEGDEQDAPGDWWDPVDRLGATHPTVLLAEKVADAARQMVDTGQLTGKDGALRPVTAGDILILVQSRGPVFHETIRACKARGLNVAGADVLKLTEELAVKDILALLAFLDTPEDDLSLAACLRSPLCGWSEADLYTLAAGRGGQFLWQTLRVQQEAYPQTHAMLSDLRDQADFLRPFELIDRILTRHDGRRRLIARLGEEAADAIDALVNRALAHESGGIPSLTRFLAEQESRQAQIKRQAEARGSKLRVMTVHGAKGLESPIVILPDTAEKRGQRQERSAVIADVDGTPLWVMAQGEAPAALQARKDVAVEARLAEARRLLYVAMTRAEQWLIVAAAGKLGRQGDTWYEQVAAGMERAGAGRDIVAGEGLVLQSAHWPAPAAHAPPGTSAQPAAAPTPWVNTPAAVPARAAGSVAPSDLGGAKALPGDAGLSEEEALARGTRLHLLLEHLPAHPRERWSEIAPGLLAPHPALPDEIAEARAVLETPALGHLFAPDALAEVTVTAPWGVERLHGAIDRLIVTDEAVTAIDFKTNAVVPTRPEDVPEGLLRQMGAYAAALSPIYPGRRIETAILWTRNATLMPLPTALTEAALARATTPV